MSTLAELVRTVPAERLAVLLAAARRECLPDLPRLVAAVEVERRRCPCCGAPGHMPCAAGCLVGDDAD